MDSPTPFEIGAQILEAGANGDHGKLKEIKEKYASKNLKRICDVYSDFSTGYRVLHHAAETGNSVICAYLIKDFDAFCDIPSFSGDTPLILAAKAEHADVVQCLLDCGAQAGVSNKKGFTALHYAALKDNMTIMEKLLDKNAPVNIDSADGTVLQFAVTNGNLRAVKLLLKKGADPTSFSLSVGTTALVCCIKARSFGCMKHLLKTEANMDEPSWGLTPLACAAQESDLCYLKALVAAGASADKPCRGDLKPIEFAAMAENEDAVKFLFPLTTKIKTYPGWSIEGVIKYNRSKAAKETREAYNRKRLGILHDVGMDEMRKGHFSGALKLFSEGNDLEPKNPKWLSMRSMCNARAGNGVQAVRDAEEAMKLNLQNCPCPKPHYTGGDRGVAWQLFKRYHLASIRFILSPDDDEAKQSFRVALFEYFSWLYLTSCPAEMMSFFQHFA